MDDEFIPGVSVPDEISPDVEETGSVEEADNDDGHDDDDDNEDVEDDDQDEDEEDNDQEEEDEDEEEQDDVDQKDNQGEEQLDERKNKRARTDLAASDDDMDKAKTNVAANDLAATNSINNNLGSPAAESNPPQALQTAMAPAMGVASVPQQQQQHHHMPMMPPPMGYPPIGFHPMMMMSPHMYGMIPAPYTPMPVYGVETSAKGTKRKGNGNIGEHDGSQMLQQQQQQYQQHHLAMMNPAMMNAAMMYNPYMMQQFHGMMNPFYQRPGYPPMMNQTQYNVRKGISLALSVDGEMLSEYQLLVRQQLELFEAGPEDVESNTQGRKKQVSVGQVGLRCRHCAPFPIRARGRGAVYYPAKLNGIYQAAQNMAGSHLCHSCQQIPPLIKADLQKLRERRDNANGGKQYWADGCVALGVYETDEGLRLRSRTAQSDKEGKKGAK